MTLLWAPKKAPMMSTLGQTRYGSPAGTTFPFIVTFSAARWRCVPPANIWREFTVRLRPRPAPISLCEQVCSFHYAMRQ